jgi:hypothetical protein
MLSGLTLKYPARGKYDLNHLATRWFFLFLGHLVANIIFCYTNNPKAKIYNRFIQHLQMGTDVLRSQHHCKQLTIRH